MANLFKNIEDLQSVVGVANGASLNAILVKETDAYNLFLKKYYHPDFWDATITASNAVSPSADMAKLLPYVKRAIGKTMMALWIPEGAVQIDDNGISVFNNESVRPASDVKIQQLYESLMREGLRAVEELLEFLETNKDVSAYALWKTNNYAVYHELFITTAIDFTEYANISGRSTFVALVPTMKSIERFDVSALVQKALYTSLKTKMEGGTLTGKYLELHKLCRGFIANKTLAQAVVLNRFVLDEYGLTFLEATSPLVSQNKKAATTEQANMLKATYEAEAKKWEQEIRNYLFDNAADLSEYTKPTKSVVDPIENTIESPNFYL